MTIDNILTAPPTLSYQDGEQSSTFDLKLQKKTPERETIFKLPFIVDSPVISKLESDTKKICSMEDFNTSEKDRETALYYHSDSRSPESAVNTMANKTGMEWRKSLEYITPTAVHSLGYKEKLNANVESSTETWSGLEYWYSKKLDVLLDDIVNGLLDAEDDNQLNGQFEYISLIWDNSDNVDSSLQGSYIYSKKVTSLQMACIITEAVDNFIPNRNTFEKLYKNNEINFKIWEREKPTGQKLSDFNEKNSKVLECEYSFDKTEALEAQMIAAIYSPPLRNPYNINNVNYVSHSNHGIQADQRYQMALTIQSIPDLFITVKFEFPKTATYSEDYRLIDNPNGKLSPNDNLTETYKKYASKYFSINEAGQLIDYLKGLMTPLKKLQEIRKFGDNMGHHNNTIDHFSNFLLWHKEMKSRPSSSCYYTRGVVSPSDRNLFLCVTKNGKLDICYAPKTSQLYLRRGDVVMTHDNNGYDLAAVIEPVIGKKLAHIVQFLKKKLQIDALSAPDKIHNNFTFIQDFIRTIRDGNELTDTSIYGLIDMTRSNCFRSRIMRFATKEETTEGLSLKFQDELKLLHVIKTKIDSYNKCQIRNYRPQINVKLLATEIQFDRSKVGVHFIGDYNTDFGSISSDIFQVYKIRIYFHSIPNNLGVDERYFRYTCNELSMLRNMVESRSLPYVHYNNNIPSYDPADIFGINDYKNRTLELNPTNDKWKDICGLSAMELDNYYVGAYGQLITDLFN